MSPGPAWYYADNVGPGWGELVVSLARELERADPGYQVIQVVQKDGALVVDMAPSRPALLGQLRKIAREYAERSRELCEFCGRPGEEGLCRSCAARRERGERI